MKALSLILVLAFTSLALAQPAVTTWTTTVTTSGAPLLVQADDSGVDLTTHVPNFAALANGLPPGKYRTWIVATDAAGMPTKTGVWLVVGTAAGMPVVPPMVQKLPPIDPKTIVQINAVVDPKMLTPALTAVLSSKLIDAYCVGAKVDFKTYQKDGAAPMFIFLNTTGFAEIMPIPTTESDALAAIKKVVGK